MPFWMWVGAVSVAIAASVVTYNIANPAGAEHAGSTNSLAGVESPSLQYSGSTLWNTFIDVVVQDTLAYCAMGAGLAILNVSDLTNPVWLSQVHMSGQNGKDLEVRDSLVYFADGSAGFKIINVSDPTNPIIVGEHATSGGWDLELAGDYLYVSEYSGLHVFDVSDPRNPVSVASNSPRALASAAHGNYLYVAGGTDGMRVVDITDPAQPTMVLTFPTLTVAQDVEVSDSTLYVSMNNSSTVHIFDLTDPALPVNTDTRSVATFVDEMDVVDSIFFGVGLERLVIADIYDPPLYYWEDILWDSLSAAIGIAVMDSHVFIADGRLGLRIVSHLGADTLPTTVGHFDAAMSIQSVAVSGSIAMYTDHVSIPYTEWRLRFVDISLPSQPQHVGTHIASGAIRDVETLGSYVYVSVDPLGLEVLDISDPPQPQSVASIGTIQPVDMAIDSGKLYTTGANGLTIYDLSNPIAPTLLGSVGAVGTAHTLGVADGFVYVMTDSTQFQVVDATDPANPVLSGSFSAGDMNIEQIQGDYAFLLDYYQLKIVDISNPASPVLTSTYAIPLRGRSAAVLGNYVYVADFYLASAEISAIRVLNISNPSLPVLEHSHLTTGFAWDLALADGHLLVADDCEGLILSIHFGRGDINEDGAVTSADLIHLANYLYKEGPPPTSGEDAGDFDCNGTVDMIDLVYLANYLLRGGPAPC